MITPMPLTGREPRLSASRAGLRGLQRLSPRRLGTLLNALSPDLISLDAAAEMLHHEGFYARFNAARILAQRGDREARLVMAEALRAGSAPTRASVARHLGLFSWYAAEPLIRQALADADPRVREGAVYALCDLRELSAYHLLVDVLAGETDDARAAAAFGLRNAHDSAAVPVLEMVLRADDPEVRIKALEALAATQTPEAIPVVDRALRADPDDEVVYNAALSLVELRGADSLFDFAILIPTIARPEPVLRGLFHATNYLHIRAAEHPAADALIGALEGALAHDDPATRMAAIWLLVWMRHPRADALLQTAFGAESDVSVRAHMLRVTASLMSAISEELIAQASADASLRDIAAQLARSAESFAAYDETDTAGRPLEREELVMRG